MVGDVVQLVVHVADGVEVDAGGDERHHAEHRPRSASRCSSRSSACSVPNWPSVYQSPVIRLGRRGRAAVLRRAASPRGCVGVHRVRVIGVPSACGMLAAPCAAARAAHRRAVRRSRRHARRRTARSATARTTRRWRRWRRSRPACRLCPSAGRRTRSARTRPVATARPGPSSSRQ